VVFFLLLLFLGGPLFVFSALGIQMRAPDLDLDLEVDELFDFDLVRLLLMLFRDNFGLESMGFCCCDFGLFLELDLDFGLELDRNLDLLLLNRDLDLVLYLGLDLTSKRVRALIISFELVAFSVAICLQISDLFCLLDFTELDRRHNDDFDLSGELDLDESSDESDDDDPDDESEEDEDDLEELDEDEDELEGDLQDCLLVKSLPLALLDGGPFFN